MIGQKDVVKSMEIQSYSILHEEQKLLSLSSPKFTNIWYFLALDLSGYKKSKEELQHFFLKRAGCCQQQQKQKCPMLALASLTCQSCALALPQEVVHWFCSHWQNLWFISGQGVAFSGESGDCQMPGRGLMDSNLNSAACQWATVPMPLSSCQTVWAFSGQVITC